MVLKPLYLFADIISAVTISCLIVYFRGIMVSQPLYSFIKIASLDKSSVLVMRSLLSKYNIDGEIW